MKVAKQHGETLKQFGWEWILSDIICQKDASIIVNDNHKYADIHTSSTIAFIQY